MPILVTGAAGFIGAHVCRALLARGDEVIGLDNYNDYYDPQLKRDRVAALCPRAHIEHADVADRAALQRLFDAHRFERVIHLAAQAGVRYSLQHPEAYAHSNLDGFLAMLEACRHRKVQHLVYASSSSVYGAGAMPPFREDARVDQPLSFYAATKAANELMAYTYAHLYGLHATGLRFFTVYGPWGRPDMAPVLFSRAVLAGREIEVFNHGRMRRDFTQVEDIVAGVLGALATPSSATPPHRVFNLGNHTPENLEDCIRIIETAAGKPALKRYRDMQPGDMPETMADTTAARAAFGFEPRIRIQDGLPPVVAWCRDYFGARA
ncbi:MAG: SDR family NAD(P)-dependent oxidoreductase [Chiayiivirga sp.]|jgi:UDP-glucuronate 4-epimerase|uniref:NAD-dependent epimerase/dehydratase family protein n=1 Tax=Chiayiivirga sp. TaxID=2041042 RepID=UPI0025C026D0|nr:NAD-dependent epimerase/dehydratase family protein [Chiayiivirga sp.]MCI1728034.1 SDR family NAD(P)-dependent oxidoreductase [Chiayiivirga sp.]